MAKTIAVALTRDEWYQVTRALRSRAAAARENDRPDLARTVDELAYKIENELN